MFNLLTFLNAVALVFLFISLVFPFLRCYLPLHRVSAGFKTAIHHIVASKLHRISARCRLSKRQPPMGKWNGKKGLRKGTHLGDQQVGLYSCFVEYAAVVPLTVLHKRESLGKSLIAVPLLSCRVTLTSSLLRASILC